MCVSICDNTEEGERETGRRRKVVKIFPQSNLTPPVSYGNGIGVATFIAILVK